jgi:MFS superfamily sulfate permease-like transporter
MSSLTIAVIGFIESIIVAKLYANKNNYYVSPNRELVAIGKFHAFVSSSSCFLISIIQSHFQNQ